MNKRKTDHNVITTLSLLHDEMKGHIVDAKSKLSRDYSMTWVYKSPKTGILFPRSKRQTGPEFDRRLNVIYQIKGREYDVRNVASGRGVVMIEMIENYPDPKTRKIYRTPLVLVLKFSRGKVRTGRHYCDPNISHLHLSKRAIDKAFAP